MSYPASCRLDVKLRETLFLILAREGDKSICSHLGCSERTVTGNKTKLMEKLCGKGDTDTVLIYHAAKSCPELCRVLADEFRDKHRALATLVESQNSVQIKFAFENGMKELYVWP